MSQEYENYKIFANYKDHNEFKADINESFRQGFIPIGGISVTHVGSTTYYAQAVAKLKEQPCKENQLILS